MKSMLLRSNRNRPTDEELKSMWKTIRFQPKELMEPEFVSLINFFTELFPGEHIFKCFSIENNECFDYFFSRHEFLALDFLNKVFFTDDIKLHVPELIMEKVDYKLFSYFRRVSSLCLDGEIATMLFNGNLGGHSPFNNGKDAKEFGLKVSDRIINHRYNEFVIFQSEKPWCPWLDSILHETLIIIDKRNRLIYIICISCEVT